MLTGKALLSCPSMAPQPHCSLPWCGATGAMDAHHVIYRSQGGEDGPTVVLCHSCHMKHHDDNPLHFGYDDEDGWWVALGDEWIRLVIYNEHAQPEAPQDVGELLTFHAEDISKSLSEIGRRDWLIGNALESARDAVCGDLTAITDWACESFDLTPSAASQWVTRRIQFGSLPPHMSHLGITRGCLVARLAESHPLDEVYRDITTMPRAQFNAKYKTGSRYTRLCPNCGHKLGGG